MKNVYINSKVYNYEHEIFNGAEKSQIYKPFDNVLKD